MYFIFSYYEGKICWNYDVFYWKIVCNCLQLYVNKFFRKCDEDLECVDFDWIDFWIVCVSID